MTVIRLRRFLPLLFVGAMLACEGPTGPEGPPGPQGEPGPGTRLTFSGQIDGDGTALVSLPEEAGTEADPPAVTGYIAETSAGPWLVVSDGYTSSGTPWLALGTNGGRLAVAIIDAPPGWHYRIVVVF